MSVWFAKGLIEQLKDSHTDLVFGFDTVYRGQACVNVVTVLTKKGCPTKHAILFKTDLEAESQGKPTVWQVSQN